MKILKTKSDEKLKVKRVHHASDYELILDRSLCVGCELCSKICPREAISVSRKPKVKGQKTERALVDIDEGKCQFCGICSAICPYGAVQVSKNGQVLQSVVEKESFPQLIREIKVDVEKCPTDCTVCEEACPLQLIKVKSNSSTGRVTVDIKKELCPCCGICEIKCPESVIRVRRIFSGKLKINQDKCPVDCKDCVDVCPITGTLTVSEKNGKVEVNELLCTFCGACKVVCPEDSALEISRTSIHHTPVRSGAWNKALEKLTSTSEMTKELRGKGRRKTMDAVRKRLQPRGE
ncbi:MAG: 4Fe-4S dicluster domain-containing protein [Candidatus Bathyarchaeota archaeon]|nr:MAG: 4Fe-4S dicluster domain-containing protein [Candidatus Bathyarchaeota archaeon]